MANIAKTELNQLLKTYDDNKTILSFSLFDFFWGDPTSVQAFRKFLETLDHPELTNEDIVALQKTFPTVAEKKTLPIVAQDLFHSLSQRLLTYFIEESVADIQKKQQEQLAKLAPIHLPAPPPAPKLEIKCSNKPVMLAAVTKTKTAPKQTPLTINSDMLMMTRSRLNAALEKEFSSDLIQDLRKHIEEKNWNTAKELLTNKNKWDQLKDLIDETHAQRIMDKLFTTLENKNSPQNTKNSSMNSMVHTLQSKVQIRRLRIS